MSKRQVAVLVDAGYFFKQGMEALFGPGKSREETALSEAAAVRMLSAKASEFFGREVLRVYWYDAPPSPGEPSASQRRLALCDGVKLRLGTLNGAGQQKGVDGLIISDMTALARNGAVDALLLVSGDEDLRQAMEEAQSYGVKTMILGLGEEGNASIAGSMAACSDGVRRLAKSEIATLLRLGDRSGASPAPVNPPKASAKGKAASKRAAQTRAQPPRERSAPMEASASGSRPDPSAESLRPPQPQAPAALSAALPAPAERSDHPAPRPSSQSNPQPASQAHSQSEHRDGERHGEGKRKNRRGARPTRHQKQALREQQRELSARAPEESGRPVSREASVPAAPAISATAPAQPTPASAPLPALAQAEPTRPVAPSADRPEPIAPAASAAPESPSGQPRPEAPKKPARKSPARKSAAKAPSPEPAGGAEEARPAAKAPARKRSAKPAPKPEG